MRRCKCAGAVTALRHDPPAQLLDELLDMKARGLDFEHAWRLAFDHPVSGERVELEAAPPEETVWQIWRGLYGQSTPVGSEAST